MNLKSVTLHDTLEETLLILPQHWLIIPVGYNKRPLGYNWPSRALSVDKFISELDKFKSIPILNKTGEVKRIYPPGIGLLTGPNSQEFLIAVDIDGESAEQKLEEISGSNIPPTVSFTSGRPHRRQLLFSAPLGMELRSQKIPTGEGEGLEFRGKNLQSVLPPSPHPITGCYKWVAGLAPKDIEVAPAPNWLLDLLSKPVPPNKRGKLVKFQPPASRHSATGTDTTDYLQYTQYTGYNQSTTSTHTTGITTAKFLLTKIHPKYADDYDWWITVGMALKFISPSLLNDWDRWSRLSPKYKAGECVYKWHSFNDRGITDRTLYWLAHQS